MKNSILLFFTSSPVLLRDVKCGFREGSSHVLHIQVMTPCLATLALRIHFDGQGALRVLGTDQDDTQSLIPWLREVLTSLRLPHPKPSNVIRPNDYTSVIDMYWDLASTQTLVRAVVNRCNELEYSTLQDRSIGFLTVYAHPLTLPVRAC
ncbi:hypothetical protein BC827DRAFT_842120 [Russula dissimulans]|nr:hypothetical protein BC827DRAFT_842120 [Russula dissimulans]